MALHPVLIGASEDAYHRGRSVQIASEARRRSLVSFGGSGSGKSTLFRNILAQDIAAGHGATVVDPHGQLVEDVIEHHIPRFRTNDVIYIKVKDRGRVIGLNLLHCPRGDQRALVVSNAIGIFKRIWADSFGPRMEDIFRNGLHTLVEQPRPVSIVALPKLLTDADYRAAALRNVSNPSVLDFFHTTYDHWDKRFREEAISPVLNKVRAFLTDPARSKNSNSRKTRDIVTLVSKAPCRRYEVTSENSKVPSVNSSWRPSSWIWLPGGSRQQGAIGPGCPVCRGGVEGGRSNGALASPGPAAPLPR
jgi:hypothetical protein